MLRVRGMERPLGAVQSSPNAASMKVMLDAIDEIRTTLSGLKSTDVQPNFYEEVLASLPQFVACGPQSAGKSSVLRRISGISLPEASTLSTRIATMVQMRRDAAAEPSMDVILCDSEGCTISEKNFKDPRAVREAVSEAQETALARSGKDFVDDYTVLVKVHGKDQPNVTLVDLPGFHTTDDKSTETVNKMVQRYVEMPGTLALHVIKGDQDYGSLLGNDFMRVQCQGAPRVTVLTHCDKITSTPEETERLRATLECTSENSSLAVAVLGSASSDEEEMDKLKHLADMDPRLELGAFALGQHLERRMEDHLKSQYPKAIEKIKKSLIETNARLDEIKERPPHDILAEMVLTIRNSFAQQRKSLMNDVRTDLDTMTTAVKNHEVMPVCEKTTAKRKLQSFDTFSEPLECGQTVYLRIKADDKYVGPVTISDVNGQMVKWRAVKDETTTGETAQAQILSGEIAALSTLIEDIKHLAEDRGMRNTAHVDRQPIIARYAAEFAKHYTKEMRKAADNILAKLKLILEQVFKQHVPEIAMPVADRLHKRMEEEMKVSEQHVDNAIAAMKAHNTEPDLIFR